MCLYTQLLKKTLNSITALVGDDQSQVVERLMKKRNQIVSFLHDSDAVKAGSDRLFDSTDVRKQGSLDFETFVKVFLNQTDNADAERFWSIFTKR